MYKFIHNGKVIDVVKSIRYLRYMSASGHIAITDSSSANCVEGSDNITVYALQGVTPLATLPYEYVEVKQINQDEYTQLVSLLSQGETVSGDSTELSIVRKKKIEELSEDCSQTIYDGISIKLEDNQYHKFELTIEDQLNLAAIQHKLNNGATNVIYHEKNQVCRTFEKDEMQHIIDCANHHVEYNTTYFNLLRHCINNMYNIEEIRNISYGDSLPDGEYFELLSKV